MKLNSLKIANFRSFGPGAPIEPLIEIPDDRCSKISFNENVIYLLGKNNSGKSSILHAYEKLYKQKSTLNLEDFHNKDTNNTVVIEAELLADNQDELDVQNDNVGKWFSPETKLARVRKRWEGIGAYKKETFDPSISEWTEGGFGGWDSILQNRLPEPIWVRAIMEPQEIVEVLQKLIKEAVLKNIQTMAEYVAVTEAITALSTAIDGDDYTRSVVDQLNLIVGQVFPGTQFDISSLYPEKNVSSLFDKQATISVTQEGSPNLPLAQQGHGLQRQFILSALRGLYSQFAELKKTKNKNLAIGEENFDKSKIILFEEPELFLHPNAVKLTSDLIYELSSNSPLQILATTHSPNLVNLSKNHQNIVRVMRYESGSKARQIGSQLFNDNDRDAFKLAYSLNRKITEFLFADEVILVEGHTEEVVIQCILERLKAEQGISPQREIYILNATSKNEIKRYQKIMNHFHQDYHVVHDSDADQAHNSAGEETPIWQENNIIWDLITKARENESCAGRYVMSPEFEPAHGYEPKGLGKPYDAFKAAKGWNLDDANKPIIEFLRHICGEICDKQFTPDELQQELS
jgi:predicted ATP-dependent endonuclease of OLD family